MARVLVVDDDPQVRRLFVAALRKFGFEAEGVAGVRAAAAAQGPWHAMVLDIGLPDGGPADVVLAHPGVPFLTISGGDGADLSKPVSIFELVGKVKQLLKKEGG